jgi:hypothetical protein
MKSSMRVVCRTAILMMALAVALPASAQFGHPLKGTWSGDWGTSKDRRTHIVLEMNWDGKAITGTINPGPKSVPLQKASLDPDTWTVHLEADGKDASGNAVHYAIDGKLENIGAYQRVLSGTWTEGGIKGDFKVTRN